MYTVLIESRWLRSLSCILRTYCGEASVAYFLLHFGISKESYIFKKICNTFTIINIVIIRSHWRRSPNCTRRSGTGMRPGGHSGATYDEIKRKMSACWTRSGQTLIYHSEKIMSKKKQKTFTIINLHSSYQEPLRRSPVTFFVAVPALRRLFFQHSVPAYDEIKEHTWSRRQRTLHHM